jgi:hypothetical protein
VGDELPGIPGTPVENGTKQLSVLFEMKSSCAMTGPQTITLFPCEKSLTT